MFLQIVKELKMEAVFLIYCFSLMAFIVGVLYISGAGEALYLLVYTSPKSKKLGKVIFGIGESIIGAVIFAVLAPTAPFTMELVVRYIVTIVIGLIMIWSGSELEEN